MVGGPEIALLSLLLVATATDLLWGKIYNWLTFPFLLTGLVTRFAFQGVDAGLEGLLAVGVALALFFPLYAVQAVAAGDAKLLMAMGAWSNAKTVFEVAVVSILVGAFVGLITLVQKKGIRGSAKSLSENFRAATPTATAVKMAFGPAFFCAYLIVTVAQMRHWELL